jgi:hypothetical protein
MEGMMFLFTFMNIKRTYLFHYSGFYRWSRCDGSLSSICFIIYLFPCLRSSRYHNTYLRLKTLIISRSLCLMSRTSYCCLAESLRHGGLLSRSYPACPGIDLRIREFENILNPKWLRCPPRINLAFYQWHWIFFCQKMIYEQLSAYLRTPKSLRFYLNEHYNFFLPSILHSIRFLLIIFWFRWAMSFRLFMGMLGGSFYNQLGA